MSSSSSSTPEQQGQTLLITGNGLFATASSFNFQTPQGIQDMFGYTQWAKHIRETNGWIETTLNVLTPVEVFGKDNSVFLLHGFIGDNSVPDRDCLVKDRYPLAKAWLDDQQQTISKIIFVGVSLCGHNGRLLLDILGDIVDANPQVQMEQYDTKPKKAQVNWLKKNVAGFNPHNMAQHAMTAHDFFQSLDAAVQTIDDLVFPSTNDLNRCFATPLPSTAVEGSWVANPCPVVNDMWALDLWDKVATDNGLPSQIKGGGVERSQHPNDLGSLWTYDWLEVQA